MGGHLPADMSLRPCLRMPLMWGILPSPLAISPLAPSRSRGKRASLLLSRRPGARPRDDLCMDL